MRSDERAITGRSTEAAAFIRALAAGATAYMILLASAAHAADIPSTEVVVTNAWIRWLPDKLPAAGYATLRNLSDRPTVLVGASTPDYGAVMFHESRNQHGVEQMLPVSSIAIKAHSQVSFAPQSYHIMLMQPTRSIQPGDQVLLTLHFGDGHSLTVQFEVRTPDGSPVKRASGSNVG
jgi:copper(I)-binding protein